MTCRHPARIVACFLVAVALIALAGSAQAQSAATGDVYRVGVGDVLRVAVPPPVEGLGFRLPGWPPAQRLLPSGWRPCLLLP